MPLSNEGRRIVDGARLVQAETDILLGWTTIDGVPFIVRHFRNLKGDIDPSALEKDHLDDYGRLAGALLARAHTRSLHPQLLAGYFAEDEELDEAIGAYASQTAIRPYLRGSLLRATAEYWGRFAQYGIAEALEVVREST